jgi:hypothetical protein
MAHSVKITTPIPSLEEFGKALGMSKARRRSLNPIFIERRPQGDYAVRRGGSEKATNVLPTQREAIERARELSPSGTILIERVRSATVSRPDRVRNTAVGKPDEWRKP